MLKYTLFIWTVSFDFICLRLEMLFALEHLADTKIVGKLSSSQLVLEANGK